MREWKNSNDKGVIKGVFFMRGEESWEGYSHMILELKTLFTITYMLSLMKTVWPSIFFFKKEAKA